MMALNGGLPSVAPVMTRCLGPSVVGVRRASVGVQGVYRSFSGA